MQENKLVDFHEVLFQMHKTVKRYYLTMFCGENSGRAVLFNWVYCIPNQNQGIQLQSGLLLKLNQIGKIAQCQTKMQITYLRFLLLTASKNAVVT